MQHKKAEHLTAYKEIVTYLLNTRCWTKILVWFLELLRSRRIRQFDSNCIPVLVLDQFRMLLVHFINNQVRSLNIITINLFNIIGSLDIRPQKQNMQPKDTSNCHMTKSEKLQRTDNDLQESTKENRLYRNVYLSIKPINH